MTIYSFLLLFKNKKLIKTQKKLFYSNFLIYKNEIENPIVLLSIAKSDWLIYSWTCLAILCQIIDYFFIFTIILDQKLI